MNHSYTLRDGLAVICNASNGDLRPFLSHISNSHQRTCMDVVIVSPNAENLYHSKLIDTPHCKVIFLHTAAALRRAKLLRQYKFFYITNSPTLVTKYLTHTTNSTDSTETIPQNSTNTDQSEVAVWLEAPGMDNLAKDFERLFDNAIQKVFQSRLPQLPTRSKHDTKRDLIICSFHTVDEYYANCAHELRSSLSNLGLAHDIRPIEVPDGMKWPDICRKKIQFYYNCFKQHYDNYQTMLWIDADCSLLYVPQFIHDFQVDFMAFRRGFPTSGSPARVKTRCWEPCFFAFASNERCLRLLEYAAAAEQSHSGINATDDYFFEEAWRAVGKKLTYFEIPGEMAMVRGRMQTPAIQCRSRNIFFRFGSSGCVDEFKGKVVQHQPLENAPSSFLATTRKKQGKPLEYALKIAQAEKSSLDSPDATIYSGLDENSRHLAKSIHSYIADAPHLDAFWWIRPAPGNMGDWLSPYILQRLLGRSIRYAPAAKASLVSLGSIGRFVEDHHLVWGTGISEAATPMSKNAAYLAVRGPYTAQAIRRSGGKPPEVFGDPGVLMSLLYKPKSSTEKGRFGFVRHFVHQEEDISVSPEVDEINILLSHPREIELFVDRLNRCEAVATTSLHVYILCNSYKIPCALIEFAKPTRGVHGDGVKYRDFHEGAGLRHKPHAMVTSIDPATISAIAHCEYCSYSHKSDLMNVLLKNTSKHPSLITS